MSSILKWPRRSRPKWTLGSKQSRRVVYHRRRGWHKASNLGVDIKQEHETKSFRSRNGGNSQRWLFWWNASFQNTTVIQVLISQTGREASGLNVCLAIDTAVERLDGSCERPQHNWNKTVVFFRGNWRRDHVTMIFKRDKQQRKPTITKKKSWIQKIKKYANRQASVSWAVKHTDNNHTCYTPRNLNIAASKLQPISQESAPSIRDIDATMDLNVSIPVVLVNSSN